MAIKLIFDTIHDHGLDQLVTEATCDNTTLDLILCSHPYVISDINIIRGISDHEALLFCLGSFYYLAHAPIMLRTTSLA